MKKYPKEDKCHYCGQHLGYIMNPIGEMVALGLCEKPECQEQAKKEIEARNNGSESNKRK